MNMKKSFAIALSCLCAFSFTSLAQSSRTSSSSSSGSSSAAADEEEKEPNTGVVLVAFTSGGARIPSTLYYQNTKKEFVKFSVPQNRPSKRLAFPRDGAFKFWVTDPTGADFDSDEKKSKSNAKVTIPEPYMTVAVPSGSSGKMICLLQAQEDGKDKLKTTGTYIPDSALPSVGQVIVNLSPYSLVLATSSKGDFSDKKQAKIAACSNLKNIESSNIYPFPGTSGTRVNYVLQAQLPGFDGLTRVRASTLNISKTQTQLVLVLKDTKKPGAVVTAAVQVKNIATPKSSSKR